ncbi:hypothetical protein L579_1244 [Pantoea sp. AS-PWVM4]|uniref:glycosyltransferase n=1 Tax=Pantoea sp. AS-PWVM4 TaxID=1332069 RepID=UPI0003AC7D2D|nr:glycosyltransferase [Pantoea sp. AS-PWVM4]ERK09461.1 hypothetical protein L579_1244 [Pantoea sp. AS-PWVM4]
MRILMINTLYYPYKVGGAEVSVRLLAESLVKRGHTVRVLSVNDRGVRIKEIINGVESVSVGHESVFWPFANKKLSIVDKLIFHANDFFNIRMQKKIKNEIEDFRPDIAHTNNLFCFSCLTWMTLSKKNVKIVHTTRDYYMLHLNAALFRNGKNIDPYGFEVKILSWIKSRISHRVSTFVGISEYMSKIHRSAGFANRGNHKYIYNTVTKMERNRKAGKKLVVGFIGRLTVEKGLDRFCQLARTTQETNDNVEFIAAGALESLSIDLKNDCERSNVQLIGFMGVEEFINQVDAVVLPTKWNEPFGRIIVELGLAGVPTFTNLSGGTGEIAELFQSIHAMDEFSIECIMKPAAYLLDEAVVEMFSSGNICSQYETLYQKVIKNA